MENQTIENKSQMSDNKLADNKSMRELLLKKFRFELATTALLLAAICFLAWFELMGNCTAGTLLGTIVGYTLKDLRRYQNN